MNLLSYDTVDIPLSGRLRWEASQSVAVSGAEPWLRASRYRIDELRDEQGHSMHLRDELWLTVFPPGFGGRWRCEAEKIGLEVVGRGDTRDQSIHDWRTRFRFAVQRLLEMRSFEMTDTDKRCWARVRAVINVPRYKATKPMVIRQVGKVAKMRPGLTVVEWEDGTRERVDPAVFDEAFSRYPVGQAFEATVTRGPHTFRLKRADAVRKITSDQRVSPERADALWDRVVGTTKPVRIEIDEAFWLTPPE